MAWKTAEGGAVSHTAAHRLPPTREGSVSSGRNPATRGASDRVAFLKQAECDAETVVVDAELGAQNGARYGARMATEKCE